MIVIHLHTNTRPQEYRAFGSNMVGSRFADILISIKEIKEYMRNHPDDPETMLNYFQSLFYTLRPNE